MRTTWLPRLNFEKTICLMGNCKYLFFEALMMGPMGMSIVKSTFQHIFAPMDRKAKLTVETKNRVSWGGQKGRRLQFLIVCCSLHVALEKRAKQLLITWHLESVQKSF